MPVSETLPFQPIRSKLYSSRELMDGFDVTKPQSHATIPDFLTYVYFVRNGRATPNEPYAGMMEGLHDNSILRAMFEFLQTSEKPVAAIMGGHKEQRGSEPYRAVVQIAKRLTEKGFLMASGGGPGAMEATHLGALLKGKDSATVDEAIALLATEAELPGSMNIVDKDGVVRMDLVANVHRWAVPAVKLLNQLSDGGQSLAVPTWHYGHEPLTPLATHVAKYFLNSIREDVLLALATNGIIFAPGKAGTLQEVFQDAAQNYYRGEGPFSPMIFLGTKFWRETLPVEKLLEALFIANGHGDEYKRKVLFTDDIDQIVDFLGAQQDKREKMMSRLETLGMSERLATA
jgi:predicted Rossmann-fold nucleotide-binding protein